MGDGTFVKKRGMDVITSLDFCTPYGFPSHADSDAASPCSLSGMERFRLFREYSWTFVDRSGVMPLQYRTIVRSDFTPEEAPPHERFHETNEGWI